jgi:hypothetical protein
LCVVVSEERGEVSLVEGKSITNYRKKGEFRQALERGMVSGATKEKGPDISLVGVLKAAWHLKMLAVATSMLLWFLVVGPQRSELGISVPLQYTNLPTDMEITGKWMERIDVRVRGSETGLANLNPGSVKAVVNLSNVLTGPNFFRITSKNIQVPPGITISEIRPSDLQLNIDAASIKKMSVVPTVVGALPEKTKIVVSPSEVQLRAVQADLKKVTSVTTEPVNIDELRVKGKTFAPVVVKPDGVKIDSVDPIQVSVTLEAEQT